MQIPDFTDTLLLAIGLAVFLEGLLYTIFAGRMSEVAQMLADLPRHQIRTIGMVTAGCGICWMAIVRYVWMAP